MDCQSKNRKGKEMRRVKVTSVRIGDFISEYANSFGGYGFHGTVESIIHCSSNAVDIYTTDGEHKTFVIDGPAGWGLDMIYRER